MAEKTLQELLDEQTAAAKKRREEFKVRDSKIGAPGTLKRWGVSEEEMQRRYDALSEVDKIRSQYIGAPLLFPERAPKPGGGLPSVDGGSGNRPPPLGGGGGRPPPVNPPPVNPPPVNPPPVNPPPDFTTDPLPPPPNLTPGAPPIAPAPPTPPWPGQPRTPPPPPVSPNWGAPPPPGYAPSYGQPGGPGGGTGGSGGWPHPTPPMLGGQAQWPNPTDPYMLPFVPWSMLPSARMGGGQFPSSGGQFPSSGGQFPSSGGLPSPGWWDELNLPQQVAPPDWPSTPHNPYFGNTGGFNVGAPYYAPFSSWGFYPMPHMAQHMPGSFGMVTPGMGGWF